MDTDCLLVFVVVVVVFNLCSSDDWMNKIIIA